MSAGPIAIIVGAPGAGKTSVGQRVAQQLSVDFVDSDLMVEQRAGKAVSDIFIDDGEPAFRAMERDAIRDAIAGQSGVLSLGGGAVLDPDTRAALRGHRVVWLRVSIGEATRRVGMNTSRPLLLGNVRGTLMGLLDQRTPLYEEVATDVIDTDGLSVDAVAQSVLESLRADSGAGRP